MGIQRRESGWGSAFGRALAGFGLLGLIALTPNAGGVEARQTDSTLDIPAPEECDAPPRETPLFDGTPPAEPEPTLPDAEAGEPADEETAEAIEDLVRESIACANAGSLLRALSLFSDDYVRRFFVGPDAADSVELGALLQRPSTEPDPSEHVALVAVEDIVVFPDGRVGAVVLTLPADETEPVEDYLVFVAGGDGWLIDAAFPLASPDATPAA